MKKTPAAVTAAIAEARDRVAARRSDLGRAVVDGRQTRDLHQQVADMEREIAEMEAALPLLQQAEREAAAAEERKRQAEEAAQAEAARKRRKAAAVVLDDALRALGEAHRAYIAAAERDPRTTLRDRHGLRGAVAALAPELARAMELPIVDAVHRRPLAEVLP